MKEVIAQEPVGQAPANNESKKLIEKNSFYGA